MRAVIIAIVIAWSSAARADGPLEDHRPGAGAKVAGGEWGTINLGLYFAVRYLYQGGLADTYTDSTGTTKTLDLRDDFQFQKVMLFTQGWLGHPALRYLTYVWTSNPSQGLGAQVVVGGNVTYTLFDELTIGGGINSLPTTVTTRLTFPIWLRVDARTAADDYFRGSYTMGVWASGNVRDSLHYTLMLGNNLSQLGVDAGQLDMGPRTYSGGLWWTTDDYGVNEGFGDFTVHDSLGASLGASFTQSREDKESQPGTEAPDNSQLRTSDGRLLFAEGTLAPGVQVNRATYRMASLNAAARYRGFWLFGEVYRRWLDDFETTAPSPIDHLRDWGYQVQGAVTIVPRTWMGYVFHSFIFGGYGDPWDLGVGVNYYPFRYQGFRLNGELSYVRRSPVGNLSSPVIVGGNGTIFVANLEAKF